MPGRANYRVQPSVFLTFLFSSVSHPVFLISVYMICLNKRSMKMKSVFWTDVKYNDVTSSVRSTDSRSPFDRVKLRAFLPIMWSFSDTRLFERGDSTLNLFDFQILHAFQTSQTEDVAPILWLCDILMCRRLGRNDSDIAKTSLFYIGKLAYSNMQWYAVSCNNTSDYDGYSSISLSAGFFLRMFIVKFGAL
jgi:hypothetical protein